MWQRIVNLAQIEAIQESTLLLKYPQSLIVPDTLDNNNIGQTYRVVNLEANGYNLQLINPSNPQEDLEAIYPSPITIDGILNNRWFFHIG